MEQMLWKNHGSIKMNKQKIEHKWDAIDYLYETLNQARCVAMKKYRVGDPGYERVLSLHQSISRLYQRFENVNDKLEKCNNEQPYYSR